jgi:hypothetical protein
LKSAGLSLCRASLLRKFIGFERALPLASNLLRPISEQRANTCNWTHIAVVTLNPERDALIKTPQEVADKRPLAA